jgi:hypothetical protein
LEGQPPKRLVGFISKANGTPAKLEFAAQIIVN